MTSPAWVSWISWVRLVLVLICCSTPENCTSSLVNWLVSSGLVGSWFCNCVISSLRKSPKFADREFSAVLPAGGVAAVLAVFCCAVTDARLMWWFPFASCGDVEAAAHPARPRGRREQRVRRRPACPPAPALGGRPAGARHANRRRSARLSPRLARVSSRIAARRRIGRRDVEGDAAAFRRHAGLVQRALQLRLIAQQQCQGLGLLDGDLDARRCVERTVDPELRRGPVRAGRAASSGAVRRPAYGAAIPAQAPFAKPARRAARGATWSFPPAGSLRAVTLRAAARAAQARVRAKPKLALAAGSLRHRQCRCQPARALRGLRNWPWCVSRCWRCDRQRAMAGRCLRRVPGSLD